MAALSPDALARLARLRLKTRGVVEGLLSGQHRSPHRGQSVEFAEHKDYSPGDEVRHIDWKAFGKFDRYFIKRYEQETNLSAYLVIDGSASMAYGASESKFERAEVLALGLATVLAQQQDLVGLAIWAKGKLTSWPPHGSAAHVSALMEQLAAVQPAGPTDLGALSEALAEKLRRRSLVVVLSDLFDPQPGGLGRLLALRARGHDLGLLHLLDRDELEFPFEDPTLFLAMEDDRRLELDPRDLRRGYLEEFGRFLDQTLQLCRERDCDYQRALSDQPAEAVLATWLAGRGRRRAGRR